MIALELSALIAMAIVFMLTFVESARSHTRARAWQVVAIAAQNDRDAVRPGDTVIDARDRFGANRRGREGAESVAEAA